MRGGASPLENPEEPEKDEPEDDKTENIHRVDVHPILASAYISDSED